MGIRLIVEYTNSSGDKCDIVICHRPLGKRSLARGSRGANDRGFREIMGKAKEKKQHGSQRIYTVVQRRQ
jgi:hypothetical protein